MTDLEDFLAEWGSDLPTLLHSARWGFDLDDFSYRLMHDPQFAIEMRLCKDWRIPHSAFLSWAPEDQAKALAHMVFEAQRCDSCGIHPKDWPDPDEPEWQVAVKVCPGCVEIARWQRWANEAAEANNAKDSTDGVKPYLRRRKGP